MWWLVVLVLVVLEAAKGPEKEKLRQEVTPSMRANLIRIIGRYHSHVLPARGGADASTIAGTASTAAASTAAAAASTAAATDLAETSVA